MHRAAYALRLSVSLSVLFAAVSPSALASTPALHFGPRTVSVTGATAGGEVAFFAVAKEWTDGSPAIPLHTRHAVVLHDHDRDGSVVFERERDLPLMAIWIAVDMTSGRWAAGTSPGFEPDLLPQQEFAKHDNAGQLRKLSAALPEMQILLVRPGGKGAWTLHAVKRGKLDESARGERPLRIDVGTMIPLGEGVSDPPNSLHGGDVLALVEPRSMRFAVVEVGK